jgi:biotin carboxyl carrier protein
MKMRITIDAQSYKVEVGDLNARPVLVTVDGETFEIWPDDGSKASLPVTLTAPAASAVSPAVSSEPLPGTADRLKSVLAPIPGVILSLSVKVGDTVAFGQELCVLEAMKMKNLIRANRSGTISVIRVSPGDQVKHGQVLLEFDD